MPVINKKKIYSEEKIRDFRVKFMLDFGIEIDRNSYMGPVFLSAWRKEMMESKRNNKVG